MLIAGDRAPNFTAQNQHDLPVSLTDLLQAGRLLLYFYPADFTAGCTKEACWLRDLHGQLLAAKVGVAGVSPQSPASHAAFAAKYSLPFTCCATRRRCWPAPMAWPARWGSACAGPAS